MSIHSISETYYSGPINSTLRGSSNDVRLFGTGKAAHSTGKMSTKRMVMTRILMEKGYYGMLRLVRYFGPKFGEPIRTRALADITGLLRLHSSETNQKLRQNSTFKQLYHLIAHLQHALRSVTYLSEVQCIWNHRQLQYLHSAS